MIVLDDEALEALRRNVLEAVNAAFDQAIRVAQQPAQQEETELHIVPGDPEGEFTYTFPGNERVKFVKGRWYAVDGPFGKVKMLLAEGEVEIWREIRQVRFVFGRKGGPQNPLTTGDWVQFLQTDDGEFASAIKDPSDPHKMLKDGMPLPARYANAKVARRDALFAPVKTGPTLWYVVPEANVNAMLTHGYYAGRLHGRF